MCYAKPGPRCAAHTAPALAAARKAVNSDPSDANLAAMRQAEIDYYTTPRGIKELRASDKESDHVLADACEKIRESQEKVYARYTDLHEGQAVAEIAHSIGYTDGWNMGEETSIAVTGVEHPVMVYPDVNGIDVEKVDGRVVVTAYMQSEFPQATIDALVDVNDPRWAVDAEATLAEVNAQYGFDDDARGKSLVPPETKKLIASAVKKRLKGLGSITEVRYEVPGISMEDARDRFTGYFARLQDRGGLSAEDQEVIRDHPMSDLDY